MPDTLERFDKNPWRGSWDIALTRLGDGRTDGRTDGRKDGRTDGQPENIMPPAPFGRRHNKRGQVLQTCSSSQSVNLEIVMLLLFSLTLSTWVILLPNLWHQQFKWCGHYCHFKIWKTSNESLCTSRARTLLFKEKEAASKAHQQFQQNPYQYAKPLLDEKAQRSTSFKEVNSARKKDYKYHPLPGMRRPPKPTTQFNTKLPTLSELSAYLHKQRNASALGTNCIPLPGWCGKSVQKQPTTWTH